MIKSYVLDPISMANWWQCLLFTMAGRWKLYLDASNERRRLSKGQYHIL